MRDKGRVYKRAVGRTTDKGGRRVSVRGDAGRCAAVQTGMRDGVRGYLRSCATVRGGARDRGKRAGSREERAKMRAARRGR